MIVDCKKLTPTQIYQTMVQTVIPRPIAWTLTENSDASYNLAPFSYFNVIGSSPPMVSLSIGKRKDGRHKDTRNNIAARQFFTVHIPSVENAQLVTDSAKPFEENISEVSALNLPLVAHENYPLPRLKQCQVAYFCKKDQIISLGKVPQNLIIGIVEAIYIADECVKASGENYQVDATKINPLARLGGKDYCTFGKPFTVNPSD